MDLMDIIIAKSELGENYGLWQEYIDLYESWCDSRDIFYNEVDLSYNLYWSFNSLFCYDVVSGLLERNRWEKDCIKKCIKLILNEIIDTFGYNIRFKDKDESKEIFMMLANDLLFTGRSVDTEVCSMFDKDSSKLYVMLSNNVYELKINNEFANTLPSSCNFKLYTPDNINLYQLHDEDMNILISLDFNIFYWNALDMGYGYGELTTCSDSWVLRSMLLK